MESLTIRILLSAAALLFLCPAYGSAQELINNGDFTKNFTGWTHGPSGANGGGANPALASQNVTGGGNSNAFGINPGGIRFPGPPYPHYFFKQSVLGVPLLKHLLLIDVHVFTSFTNAQGGRIEVWLGGSMVYSFTRFNGRITGGTDYRERLGAVVAFTKTGMQDFELRIIRERLTSNSRTPHWSIDNVSLVRAVANPVLLVPGERVIGGTLNLNLSGSPSHAILMLLAAKGGPALTFPGIGGAFKLDLGTLVIFGVGVLNTSGNLNLPLPIPNTTNLKGISLAFQGLQAGTSSSLGNAQIGIAIKP